MQDNRKHKRYVTVDLDIKCRMLFATEVQLLDMSISGASIIVDKRLNMGDKYAMKIEDRGENLSLRGEVIWVSISGSKKLSSGEIVPLYKAGIKFDNVLTGKGSRIMGYLTDTVNKKQLSVRLGGVRVRIDSASSVLDVPHGFTIKKISRGGVLLETDRKLDTGQVYPLEITLFKGDGQPLRCKGKVASCVPHPSGNPELFDVGVEFVDLSETDLTRLSQFLNRLDRE